MRDLFTSALFMVGVTLGDCVLKPQYVGHDLGTTIGAFVAVGLWAVIVRAGRLGRS